MPGVGVGGNFDPGLGYSTKPPPSSPLTQFGNPASFTAAANTQGSDYDRIMAEYENLANSSPISATSVAPTQVGAPGMVNAAPVSLPAPCNTTRSTTI